MPRRVSALLGLTASLACSQLGVDLDQVVAIELTFPDSGRIDVGDTLHPRARALNGRGDSVAATITWASLDTILAVDSATGASVGLAIGTARLQARVGGLRSNPENVFVLPPLDTAYAVGDTRDTVTVSTPDSLSDSLVVQVGAPAQGTNPLAGRRVVYAATIYASGVSTVTFVPRDTVKTTTAGRAAAQLRYAAGTRPDSVVVTATVRNLPPIQFVVEYRP